MNMIEAVGSHARSHYKDFAESTWKLTHKWQYVAVPKSDFREMGKRAVEIFRTIVACNTDGKFAYSQSNKRWNGYNAIVNYMTKNSCSVEDAIRNVTGKDLCWDCSSICVGVWKLAGMDFHTNKWKTYTGGLKTVLRLSGAFDIYSASDVTRTPVLGCDGAMYWKENAHVIMACVPKDEEPEEPIPEPTIEGKTLTALKSGYNIRTAPNTKSKSLGKTAKGQVFAYKGKEGKWYSVVYEMQTAYIHEECAVRIEGEKPNEPLPDDSYTYFRVNGGTLRIREKPSTLSKTLGFTSEADKYLLLNVTDNGWFETDYRGQTAYVSGNTRYTEVINGD